MTYQNPNKEVQLIRLGLVDYKEAWDYQEKLYSHVSEIKLANRNRTEQEETPNYLILCEHPPVYTLGKSGSTENLLLNEEQLKEAGTAFYKINRGGDITFHGPGQLVVYPIFDLENFFTDIHLFLRTLEEIVIKTMFDFGIKAGRIQGCTGVWIEPESKNARKICAMGVKCGRWITMHGLALNVNNEMGYFKNIIACGIKDKDVTSMKQERPDAPTEMIDVEQRFLANFSEAFALQLNYTEA